MSSFIGIAKLPLLMASALFAGCIQQAEPAQKEASAEAPPPEPEAQGPTTCSTAQEDRALATVNAARAASGQTAFRCLGKLSAMATAHARFLAQNEGLRLASSHRERAGAPGYTGDTLKQRAAAQGLDSSAYWLAEGAGGGSGAEAVVEAHLATVYHRSALLAPGGRYFAFAEEQGVYPHAVMNMLLHARAPELSAALWPSRDAKAVARRFNPSGEKPSPRDAVTDAGLPVSVHFPRTVGEDGKEPEVEVEEFRLFDDQGVEVAADLLTRAVDAEIYPSDAFLLPKIALEPGHAYHARARMTYGELTLAADWHFVTAF